MPFRELRCLMKTVSPSKKILHTKSLTNETTTNENGQQYFTRVARVTEDRIPLHR